MNIIGVHYGHNATDALVKGRPKNGKFFKKIPKDIIFAHRQVFKQVLSHISR